jgi:hypothetical protein
MSIKINSSGVNFLTAGANNTPTAYANDYQSVAYTSFKNRIINGDMRIDQRFMGYDISSYNTVLVVSPGYTYSGNTIYGPVDRWFYHVYGYGTNSITGSQVDISSTKHNFTKGIFVKTIDASTTGQYWGVGQRIEADNIIDLIGKPVVLSFWMKTTSWPIQNTSGVTYPNLTIQIRGTTSPDNWPSANIFGTNTSSSYINANLHEFSLSPPVNNEDFKFYSIPFTLSSGYSDAPGQPYPAINGISITWTATGVDAGALGNIGRNFTLTGVQLEAGSAPSDFEFLPYDMQLRMCQRYCYVINAKNDATSNPYVSDELPLTICDANTDFYAVQYQPSYMYEGVNFTVDFPTTMRKIPWMTHFQYNDSVRTKLLCSQTFGYPYNANYMAIDTDAIPLYSYPGETAHSTKHGFFRVPLSKKVLTIGTGDQHYNSRIFDAVTANCTSYTATGALSSGQYDLGPKFWSLIFSAELGQFNRNERTKLGYCPSPGITAYSGGTYDVRTVAIQNGWDQNSAWTVWIPEYVTIVGYNAMLITGTWPGGLTIVNRGTIFGVGGGGGGYSSYVGAYTPSSGYDGIRIESPAGTSITIYNYGVIAGGGGGGAYGYFVGGLGNGTYYPGGGGGAGGGSGGSSGSGFSGGYLYAGQLATPRRLTGPNGGGSAAAGSGGGAGGGGGAIYSGSGGSIAPGPGGAGGSDFPGTGGQGGYNSNYAGGYSTQAGGTGGSGVNVGSTGTYGGGGGGWGCAGGSSTTSGVAGGTGGRAIYKLNAVTLTTNNLVSGTIYGAIV